MAKLVKFPISQETRVIWSRRIKGFWEEYQHNKVGLVGLGLVMTYAFLAVFAPLLTPYDPIAARGLASGFAQPEWVTILPQNKDLPRTMDLSLNWAVKEKSELIHVIESGEDLVVQYSGTEAGTQSINFTTSFLYPYAAPDRFIVDFIWWTGNISDAEYSFDLFIINPAGNKFIFWATYQYLPAIEFTSAAKNWTKITFYSHALSQFIIKQLGVTEGTIIAREIFVEKGEYKLQLRMRFRPGSQNGTAEIHFTDSKIKILGLVHGILGCDGLGRDIFSQLIHGARISLAVGLFCAVLATSIGIAVGIVAAYSSPAVDEGLMRTVDILLCLPVLPLLLGLIVIFGTSVWYLVLLIAVFGWQGLSRIIRSRVLSLKEMPFIECARAAGASKFYIMLKHMVPNVLPVALASMILSVPAAILTEASISFIGLGDPTAPTWGRMLHYAHSGGGFFHLAWWWILPPGLAITILTLAFVFIGHAVDEIVNPRLRRRR